jgi:hypothetical protein
VYLKFHLVCECNQFFHLKVKMEFRVGLGTVRIINLLPGVE